MNKYDKTKTNRQNHNSQNQFMVTVNCTQIHPWWEHGQIYVSNNNISNPHECQKLHCLCCATPSVTIDIHALLPSVAHSVLHNHYQITKEHGSMGRLHLLTH